MEESRLPKVHGGTEVPIPDELLYATPDMYVGEAYLLSEKVF